MTLRRQPRELYHVFSEDEFLRLADWQPGASLADNAEAAVRLPQAGRALSGEPASASAAGRPRRLLMGATVATGVVGATACLLAASSYTRLAATRRWQSPGALTVPHVSDAAIAAVGVLHAARSPRPTATPSRRPAGRRDAGGARMRRAGPARVISPPRATATLEATSPPVAVPSTAPSGPRIAPRPAQQADFTFER